MAEIIELRTEPRQRIGKGGARAIRREGRVPAVVYGETIDPQMISLSYTELDRHVQTGSFLNTLFDLNIDGRKTRVIPREIQLDPVRDFLIHVDFLRLGEGATITIEVPVNFINDEESPGIKQGGVLNVVRFTIELTCEADKIPEAIDADLIGLEMGASLHISDMTLPEGAELTITDRDFTVAIIAAPAGLTEEEEEGEEEEEFEGIEGEAAEEGEAATEDGDGE